MLLRKKKRAVQETGYEGTTGILGHLQKRHSVKSWKTGVQRDGETLNIGWVMLVGKENLRVGRKLQGVGGSGGTFFDKNSH